MTNHWDKRRVLVTGGRGFLGRHICAELIAAGAIVDPCPSTECDLMDATQTASKINTFKPDTIIHAAAKVGGIQANKKNPAAFFYENLQMGTNIIHQTYLHRPFVKFVLIGTVCSYPMSPAIPFVETDLWNGYPESTNAPYGIAKRALYEMAHAYYRQYGMKTLTLIPTNLYGPHDNFNPESSHVIPALIKRFEERRILIENYLQPQAALESVDIWGTPGTTREFLYVEDAAKAILQAASRDSWFGECYNIGSGQEIKMSELTHLIIESIFGENAKMGVKRGEAGYVHTKFNGQMSGQPRRAVSTNKFRSSFGEYKTTPMNEGLTKTVEYFRNLKS